MAAITFPRFRELATELQMQIWSFAATPTGELKLMKYPHCNLSSLSLEIQTACRIATYTSILLREACVLRNSMMATSRLARRIALEMWRKDAVDDFRRLSSPKIENLKLLQGCTAAAVNQLGALLA